LFDFIIAPFAWLLRALYEFTGSYGLALILFALVTKALLLYFSARGKRGMMQTQRIQPKQQALAKQYEKDKAKYQQELQKLYQDEGVSMTGGCLWTLLAFPLIIVLYGIIRAPLTHLAELAQDKINEIGAFLTETFQATIPVVGGNYDQLATSNAMSQHAAEVGEKFPGLQNINFSFLGLNLGATPTLGFNLYILIPILSGGTAFLAMWMSMKFNKLPNGQQPAGQNKFMMLLSPAMSLYFAFILPAALGVYWIAQNVIGVVQDYYLTKHYNKVFAVEDAKKAELEARRKAAEEAMKEEMRQRRAEAIADKKKKRKPGQTIYKMQKKPKSKD
jgi:YidC/Oxa1 family membrane protein insertase